MHGEMDAGGEVEKGDRVKKGRGREERVDKNVRSGTGEIDCRYSIDILQR